MPDGDKIYGLAQAYEKPYEQICEAHFGPGAIAYDILDALRDDLRRHGTAPLELIFRVADQLDDLPSAAIFRQAIDWHKESREIERKARHITGNKRALDLTADACKKYLRSVQAGESSADHRRGLIHS